MKLYVWETLDPMSDHPGLAFAIAETVEHAEELVSAYYGYKPFNWGPRREFELTEPVAFAVAGWNNNLQENMSDGQTEACEANGPWVRTCNWWFNHVERIERKELKMSHDLNAIDWTTLIPMIMDMIKDCMNPAATLDDIKERASEKPWTSHSIVRRALIRQGFSRGHELRKLTDDVIERLSCCSEGELHAMMRGDQS